MSEPTRAASTMYMDLKRPHSSQQQSVFTMSTDVSPANSPTAYSPVSSIDSSPNILPKTRSSSMNDLSNFPPLYLPSPAISARYRLQNLIQADVQTNPKESSRILHKCYNFLDSSNHQIVLRNQDAYVYAFVFNVLQHILPEDKLSNRPRRRQSIGLSFC